MRVGVGGQFTSFGQNFGQYTLLGIPYEAMVIRKALHILAPPVSTPPTPPPPVICNCINDENINRNNWWNCSMPML